MNPSTSDSKREHTQAELEYKILFSLVVAGKSASFAHAVMDRIFFPKLMDKRIGLTPFEVIKLHVADGTLEAELIRSRSGNYTKLERAFKTLVEADIDLRLCTPQDLEKVPGIGPKTSRFFIMWTRPDARYSALDTHILKWLKYLGYNAPKSTPSGKKYEELELAFLAEADKRKMTPVALDAMIWEWCEKGLHKSLGWPPELQK